MQLAAAVKVLSFNGPLYVIDKMGFCSEQQDSSGSEAAREDALVVVRSK